MRDFLAQKAKEKPERFEEVRARTPLRTDARVSVSDARLVGGAFAPDAEANDRNADRSGRRASGQAAADEITTRQRRHRAAFVSDEQPTPTRPIPESEFAHSDQGWAWYLHTRRRQSYTQVAATTGKPVGTVKAMINKATKTLAKLQGELGFSMSDLLYELGYLYDVRE